MTMEYYHDQAVRIRNMQPEDAQIFTDEECAQGWHASVEKYERRLRDQSEGRCVSLVAEYLGHPAGYVNVYPNSQWGAFGGQGLPEIVDFGVLEKYQRRGIGSRLMDVAEELASEYADTVYLGVGLHGGYGSAQRMYVKRGYLPDGTGIWHGNELCASYDTAYVIDDDLALYMSKKLTGAQEVRKVPGKLSEEFPEEQQNPKSESGVTENELCDPEGIHIRVMQPEDYEKVYALWMSCKNMGFNNIDDSRDGILKYLKRNPGTSFVAMKGDAIAGVILAGHDGRRGFIHHMAVSEACRRQGIASALLTHAMEALKAESINKVACLVFRRNDAGNAFWESQGFTERHDLAYRNKALAELIRIDT